MGFLGACFGSRPAQRVSSGDVVLLGPGGPGGLPVLGAAPSGGGGPVPSTATHPARLPPTAGSQGCVHGPHTCTPTSAAPSAPSTTGAARAPAGWVAPAAPRPAQAWGGAAQEKAVPAPRSTTFVLLSPKGGREHAMPDREPGTLTSWQILAGDALAAEAGAAGGVPASGGVPPGRAPPPGARPAGGREEALPLLRGRLSEHFELLGELGRGAFGAAVKARRRDDGSLVCIKVADPHGASGGSDFLGGDPSGPDAEAAEAMAQSAASEVLHEATMLRKAAHPHVVGLHHCLVEEGPEAAVVGEGRADREARGGRGRRGAPPRRPPSLVMELCSGGDLDRMTRNPRDGSKVALDETLAMLTWVQLALALEHVHSRGLVHRDVKPGNILVGDIAPPGGRGAPGVRDPPLCLKLADFGVSRLVRCPGDAGDGRGGGGGAPPPGGPPTPLVPCAPASDTGLSDPLADPSSSLATTLVGTPYYLAPEVLAAQPYDTRADVWAAGVVLYELASGERPFLGSSLPAVALRVLRGSAAPLPASLSPKFHALVGWLLQRDPRDRPSMRDVLATRYVAKYVQRYRGLVAAREMGGRGLPDAAVGTRAEDGLAAAAPPPSRAPLPAVPPHPTLALSLRHSSEQAARLAAAAGGNLPSRPPPSNPLDERRARRAEARELDCAEELAGRVEAAARAWPEGVGKCGATAALLRRHPGDGPAALPLAVC